MKPYYALAFLLCTAATAFAQDTQSVVVEPGKFAKIDVPFKASVFTAPLSDLPKLEGRLHPVEGGYLLTLGGDCTQLELVFLGSPKKASDAPPMVPVIAKLKGGPEPKPPVPPGPTPDPKPDPDPQPNPVSPRYVLLVYKSEQLSRHPNLAVILQSDFVQRINAAGWQTRFYDDDHPGAVAGYRLKLEEQGINGPGVLVYTHDGKTLLETFALGAMSKDDLLKKLGVK